jgi:hypothetical protein
LGFLVRKETIWQPCLHQGRFERICTTASVSGSWLSCSENGRMENFDLNMEITSQKEVNITILKNRQKMEKNLAILTQITTISHKK